MQGRRNSVIRRTLFSLCIASCILCAAASAQDWPQFGFTPAGGRYNPNETTLNSSNAPYLQLLWKFPTQAPVRSSPAVVDGVVYVGSEDGNVYAIDATTGKLVWPKPFSTGSYVESSPAVVNGVVYVAADNTIIYAINANSGTQKWQFSLGPSGAGFPVINSMTVASVLINGVQPDVLYASLDNVNVYAINAATGTVLWDTPDWDAGTLDEVSISAAVANETVYLGYCVLSASTGVGTNSGSGCSDTGLSGAPAVVDGVVYSGYSDVSAAGPGVSWGFPTGSSLNPSGFSSPAVANGVVYVGASNPLSDQPASSVYALNAGTGSVQAGWPFQAGSIGYASLAITSSPAVANGVVYVGSGDNNIYALDASTGAKLWQFTTGSTVESSPAVANGVVYVGSDDGNIYAFGLTSPPTVSITANPNPVALGQPTTLLWSAPRIWSPVTNPKPCYASNAWNGSNPPIVAGTPEYGGDSRQVTPTFSTNPSVAVVAYSLTCTGPGGSATGTVHVRVLPPTVTITASSTSITPGQTAYLTWSSTNATSCFASSVWSGTSPAINDGARLGLSYPPPPPPLDPLGLLVTPAMTTTPYPIQTFDGYSITCDGPSGNATAAVTIAVTPPLQKQWCHGWWGGGPCVCELCILGLSRGAREHLNIGGFAAFGQIQPGTLGQVFVVQSGTVEDVTVKHAPGGKLREGGDEIITVTISPGSTVVKSGELGDNVHIVTAKADSSKLLDALPKEACSELSSALLAAEHPGAKPTVVGVAFEKGRLKGLLINDGPLPPATSPAK